MVTLDPFKHTVGITEQDFLNLPTASQSDLLLKKLTSTQGTFYTHNVEPFLPLQDNNQSRCPFTFSVREGKNFTGTARQLEALDVATLQADPSNNGALFQVASNFDCLEACQGKNGTVAQYQNILAQGEICSVSALPGLLDRLYLQPAINLLERFSKKYKFTYTGGGVPFLPHLFDDFKSMSDEIFNENVSLVSVGVQENVMVTYGQRGPRSTGFKAVLAPSGQRITQVFVAALDPHKNNPQLFAFSNLAKVFLHAAYKGTCDVARKLHSKKMYLTLVGGGVFQNNIVWIAQALTNALQDLKLRECTSPLEIILIIYDSCAYETDPYWQEAKALLQKQVTLSHGSWNCF